LNTASVCDHQRFRYRAQHLFSGERQLQSVEKQRQKSARQWPGNRNVEFLNCLAGFSPDARQAAKQKQRDREHLDFVVLRHRAMSQFVEHHRSEKQQAGRNADRPMFRRSPVRKFRRELERQR